LIDLRRLDDISHRFGEVVMDPSTWPEIMEGVCKAVGASAAILLQSDVRTPDVPHTEAIAEGIRHYFKDNWHLVDPRARGFPKMMSGEVVTDHDIMTIEQIRSDPMYNEVLFPHGFQWFAGIGFRADSAAWALTLQRTGREGSFEARDKPLLARLAPRLTEAATLATAVGRTAILGITNALDLIGRPAIAIGQFGQVLGINTRAAAYLDRELLVRKGRLSLIDKTADSELAHLVDGFKAIAGLQAIDTSPIVMRRQGQRPLVLQPLPVPPAARNPFFGARAILVLTDLEGTAEFSPGLLTRVFNLTPAQANIAARIAAGRSLEEIAAELGVTLETARHHLKVVFGKTETHRQGELVALLNKLERRHLP
jgi:DNA-binding CsgD family transcriptional regulator